MVSGLYKYNYFPVLCPLLKVLFRNFLLACSSWIWIQFSVCAIPFHLGVCLLPTSSHTIFRRVCKSWFSICLLCPDSSAALKTLTELFRKLGTAVLSASVWMIKQLATPMLSDPTFLNFCPLLSQLENWLDLAWDH